MQEHVAEDLRAFEDTLKRIEWIVESPSSDSKELLNAHQMLFSLEHLVKKDYDTILKKGWAEQARLGRNLLDRIERLRDLGKQGIEKVLRKKKHGRET